MLFLGDLCLSTKNMPSISSEVDAFLKASDLVCINFEAPVLGEKSTPGVKVGPAIQQDISAIEFARACNCTHLNLANNHIMDFGTEGLRSTFDNSSGLQHLGAGLNSEEAYKTSFFEKGGVRVALLAFAEAQFGVIDSDSHPDQAGFAWIDHPCARKAIREAAEDADWVFVQVHAGLEMVDIPLPQWRARYRELIDLGADMVIGHHPHVLQGTEIYKGKAIHYSLGNFYMDVMLRQAEPGSGGVLEVQIDGKNLDWKIVTFSATLGKIDFDQSTEARIKLEKLSDKLRNELEYQGEVQKICDLFWRDVYAGYYESALLGLGTKPRLSKIKIFFRRLLVSLLRSKKSEINNQLMLLHNIRIETHRWVVEQALSNRAIK